METNDTKNVAENQEVKPAEKKREKPMAREIIEYLVSIGFTIFLFTCVFALHRVPTASMDPTIKAGSIVFCTRIQYLLGDPAPDYGDVVSFKSEEGGKILIKRVVGLPGDTITFEDGYLIRNGEKVDEPYLKEQGVTQNGLMGTYTVPEGCFFAMGDNRAHSADSRVMANPYISFDQIYAKMVCSFYPILIISRAIK